MTEPRVRPLSRLRAGQAARIASLGGGREFQARLVSMGLLVGSRITVVRGSGAAQGAALVAVGSMRLGIGRGMAEKILVTVEKHGAAVAYPGSNADSVPPAGQCDEHGASESRHGHGHGHGHRHSQGESAGEALP